MAVQQNKIKKSKVFLNINRTLIYILCSVLTFLSLILFWLAIVNSTRTKEQILQKFSLIPGSAFMTNYRLFTEKGEIFGVNLFVGFRNSFLVSGGSTILAVYFSALTAYALVAYVFKGRNVIFTIVLAM